MKRAKNLGNKLMAVLLSMAMLCSPILQSTPVYAAEIGIETEGIGTMPASVSDNNAADVSVSDNDTADGTVSDNNVADPSVSDNSAEGDAVSGNDAVDDTVSDNDATVSDNDVTEDRGTLSILGADSVVTATASDFSNVGGWNESIYAEIAGVKDADVTAVSWSGAAEGSLTGKDFEYLVRDNGNNGVRIDIPGLKAGTYALTVTVGGKDLKKENIQVYEYDRSGFAHFNYTDGVGAYNDDGTLKNNAIVLYVTDENKNTVELSHNGITVKGIGNILNSVGQESAGGLAGNGGKANTNKGIIKTLGLDGVPLVVRFIGTVSDSGLYKKGTFNAASECKIEGLTTYSSVDNGGTVGDNGHMARIQSGKDITLEGIGYDAVIDGWGFHYIAQTSNPELGKSFEVRNLTFINTPEDAIGMEGQQTAKNASADLSASVERCWIHNNEFYCPSISSPAESDKSEGDGSVDFKRGQYFTCSYNYYEGCHKTNLVGSADYSLQFNLTYHHNYWYMCKARGPLTRRANVHMYNNFIDMQTDYAMNTRADAYIFSEYNLFYACKSPHAVEAGAIKSYNDSIASVIYNKGGAATVVSDRSEIVPNNCQFSKRGIDYSKFDTNPSQSYIPGGNYELQEDFAELRKVIISQTGVQDQRPRLAQDVTVSDYSLVERSGATVNSVTPPQNLAPGKISKSVYAFEVGGAFNVEIAYADAAKPGVLVNEAGVNVLEGDGTAVNLPAGKYMIQPVNFQPGAYLKGTTAVFKEVTVTTLNITPADTNAHYHKWVKDAGQSVAPTCQAPGKNVYICKGEGTCDAGNRKEEEVAQLEHKWEVVSTTATCTEAGDTTYKCSVGGETKTLSGEPLGHDWGAWTVVRPDTPTEDGEKKRVCKRDSSHVETDRIPAGTTGSGSTAEGDYVITFDAAGKRAVGDADFFTINGSYSNSKGTATVNGETYTDCLKMESGTSITFTCNEGASLFLAFASSQSSKKVLIDGEEYTTDSKGTVTVPNLSAGSHTIKKKDSIFLFYVSVSNGGATSTGTTYSLTFEYNDDDAPEARTVQVAEGTSFASMEALAAKANFTRRGYVLSGLFTDTACTQPVTYPYVVSGDATFYAQWERGTVSYNLIFNTNGGSAVATVSISSNQIYELKERPTRPGFAFLGWYDALVGGNLIEVVDGSRLAGNYTVYAHWNPAEDMKLELDCTRLDAESLGSTTVDKDGNVTITKLTTINGFTIHALPGGVGTAGEENPKYYMTVKPNNGGLGTNGVLITDKSIPGNEDGMLKSIEFTTDCSGVLSVETALSGKPSNTGTYELVLAKKAADGSVAETGKSAITTGTTKVTKEFDIDGAGTYYLYAQGDKGVVYYSLKVLEHNFTVKYQIGNGTAPEGLAGNAVVKAGDVIQLGDCIPAAGYTFEGWSVDNGATTFKDSYTVKAEDASNGIILIAAVYKAIAYTINFDANGGVLPSGMEATLTASTGETLTLGSCTPPKGKKFLGWAIGNSTEAFSSYTVNAGDADKNKIITIKAVYVAENDKAKYYTVTIDTDGGVLVDGGATQRTIVENGKIDLGSCEKAGYVFKAWTVDGSPVAMPYTVTADVTLKATYNAKNTNKETYVIRLDLNGGVVSDGQPTSFNVPEGEELEYETLPVPTREGYKLVGWLNDKGRKIEWPYKPDRSMTIKADWRSEDEVEGLNVKLVEGDEYVYTGTAIKPEIVVTQDGRELIEGVDYTVKYSNNVKASEGVTSENKKPKITVTGKGLYSKNKVITFNIKRKDLNDDDVEKGTIIVKEGAKAVPVLVYKGVKLGSKDYIVDDPSRRYQLTDVDPTVKLKAKDGGNFTNTETVEIPVKVVAKDDLKKSAFTVTLKGDYKPIYNGQSQKPYDDEQDINSALTVTAKDGGSELTPGTDYKVVYSGDTVNAGTVKFTVVGVGEKYAGTVTKSYKISPLKVTESTKWDVTLTKDEYDYVGTGVTIDPEDLTVNFKDYDLDLKQGRDYKISYSNNKKISTDTAKAKFTISFLGNYKGSKPYRDGTFKINPASLSDAQVVIPDKVYSGKENIYKSVPYVMIDGLALKNSDFTVSYYKDSNMSEADMISSRNKVKLEDGESSATVYVKIVGKGNYVDSTTGTYLVCRKDQDGIDMSKVKITFSDPEDPATKKATKFGYTGGSVEPKVKVEYKNGKNWETLKPDEDYTLEFVNNVNKGKATVIVTALDSSPRKAVGSKTATFSIVAMDVSKKAKVEIVSAGLDIINEFLKNLK